MIYSLANEGSIYFLRCLRRFRKGFLVSTLKNYFLGRKGLLKGTEDRGIVEGMECISGFSYGF